MWGCGFPQHSRLHELAHGTSKFGRVPSPFCFDFGNKTAEAQPKKPGWEEQDLGIKHWQGVSRREV